jgi:hypothetical protein
MRMFLAIAVLALGSLLSTPALAVSNPSAEAFQHGSLLEPPVLRLADINTVLRRSLQFEVWAAKYDVPSGLFATYNSVRGNLRIVRRNIALSQNGPGSALEAGIRYMRGVDVDDSHGINKPELVAILLSRKHPDLWPAYSVLKAAADNYFAFLQEKGVLLTSDGAQSEIPRGLFAVSVIDQLRGGPQSPLLTVSIGTAP